MRGKLILIEGTDSSGKQTQAELLVKRLNENGKPSIMLSFPMYDTPTGKIIAGPYLGRQAVGGSWFSEGATNVEAKVASLYYAADRLYNVNKINEPLKKGINVILDRYTASNMAHQGGKIEKSEERYEIYRWLNDFEYGILELPRPDYSILLHMPYEYALELREKRGTFDEHEISESHLRNAEAAYLEIADLYDFDVNECVEDNNIRSIENISDELYNVVISKLSNNRM